MQFLLARKIADKSGTSYSRASSKQRQYFHKFTRFEITFRMAKRLKVDCETACMITVELDSFLSRGSEWGYLDNSKQLIFWLCNSKFYAEGNKDASKKGNVILFSISTSFRPLSDDSRSFRKTSEDFRRLPKMSGDYRSFPRRNPKNTMQAR